MKSLLLFRIATWAGNLLRPILLTYAWLYLGLIERPKPVISISLGSRDTMTTAVFVLINLCVS